MKQSIRLSALVIVMFLPGLATPTFAAPPKEPVLGFDKKEMADWKRLSDWHGWTADFKSVIDFDGTASHYAGEYLSYAGYAFALGESLLIANEGEVGKAFRKLAEWAGSTKIGGWSAALDLTIKYGRLAVKEGWGLYLRRKFAQPLLGQYRTYRMARLGQIYVNNHRGPIQNAPEHHKLAPKYFAKKVDYTRLSTEDVREWMGYVKTDWELWRTTRSAERRGKRWNDPLESWAINHYVRSERMAKKQIKDGDPTQLEDDLRWLQMNFERQILKDIMRKRGDAVRAKVDALRDRMHFVFGFKIRGLDPEAIRYIAFASPSSTGMPRTKRIRIDKNVFYFDVPTRNLEQWFGNDLRGTILVVTQDARDRVGFDFNVKEYLRTRTFRRSLEKDGRIRLSCMVGTFNWRSHPKTKLRIRLEPSPGVKVGKAQITVTASGPILVEGSADPASPTVTVARASEAVACSMDAWLTVARVAVSWFDEEDKATRHTTHEVILDRPAAVPAPRPSPDGVALPAEVPPRDVVVHVPLRLQRPASVPEGALAGGQAGAAIAGLTRDALAGALTAGEYAGSVVAWASRVPPPPGYEAKGGIPEPRSEYERFRREYFRGIDRIGYSNPNALRLVDTPARRLFALKNGEVDPSWEHLKQERADWLAAVQALAGEGRERFDPRFKDLFQTPPTAPSIDTARRAFSVQNVWYVRQSVEGNTDISFSLWRPIIRKRLDEIRAIRSYLRGPFLADCDRLLEERLVHARALKAMRVRFALLRPRDVERDFDAVTIKESSNEVRYLVAAKRSTLRAVALIDGVLEQADENVVVRELSRERRLARAAGFRAEEERAREKLGSVRLSLVGGLSRMIDAATQERDLLLELLPEVPGIVRSPGSASTKYRTREFANFAALLAQRQEFPGHEAGLGRLDAWKKRVAKLSILVGEGGVSESFTGFGDTDDAVKLCDALAVACAQRMEQLGWWSGFVQGEVREARAAYEELVLATDSGTDGAFDAILAFYGPDAFVALYGETQLSNGDVEYKLDRRRLGELRRDLRSKFVSGAELAALKRDVAKLTGAVFLLHQEFKLWEHCFHEAALSFPESIRQAKLAGGK